MPHITFIHGISNKPPAAQLLPLWEQALGREDGIDCGAEGVTTSMVYWADVMYTGPDTDGAGYESAVELEAVAEVQPEWREELPDAERQFVEALADRIGADLAGPEEEAPPPDTKPPTTPAEAAALEQLERVPLPWFIKRPLMKVLLRDVHHYLFNVDHAPRPGERFRVRDEIRSRALEALNAGARLPGPHVVVSHSMGTVIAYDCLKRVADSPPVDALVTLGSPLGLDEIQDKFRPEWTRDDGFPHERVRGEWVNVFDRLDPVAGFDAKLANDYRRGGSGVIHDIHEPNWGKWRHSITKYLRGQQLRSELRRLLDLPPL
jgi:hypothetical protein